MELVLLLHSDRSFHFLCKLMHKKCTSIIFPIISICLIATVRHSDLSSMKPALDWKSLDSTQLFSLQYTSKKSPMELISEVPPIKVEGRIVACEGDSNPALGHPIEFICLDLKEPAICKYCGLRYVQHGHHH